MKSILLGIVLLTLHPLLLGQQLPQYSQWSYHQFALNPAHAGIKRCIDLHSLYRLQWVGFDGAPNSGFVSASFPINSKRKTYLSARQGTGLRFETDRIGQFSFNRFNAAYAAHFNFNPDNRLSLGVYGGIVQIGYDPSASTTNTPDPDVMRQVNLIAPDASFGAWFNSKDYYIGLTLQNLVPSAWDGIGVSSRNRFHTTLNGGYRMTINDEWSILPGANLKIPGGSPWVLDVNLIADYRNIIGFGFGYRNTDALIAIVNVKIVEQFSIAYSFDYTLSPIQKGSNNTHEISLRFTTCKPDQAKGTNCPLFE